MVRLMALVWMAAAGAEALAGEIEDMQSERRVALVIGNGAYGPEIGPLENPTNDASDIADALRALGFEVSLELDAGRDRMRRAVIDFGRSLRDGGVGLFYFSGHAIQVDGTNYLLPLDADVASADYVPVETLEVADVLARMGGAENRLNIVILDACRNNPFKGVFRSVTRGLAQTNAPTGTYIAYAAAPGQLALDGKGGRNSPYTAALLDSLGEPGLRLEDVFKYVRRDVLASTNGYQTPWTGSSITGDFYFRLPQPVEAEREPAPTATPSPTADALVWNAIEDSPNATDFETFLDTHPDSPFAPFARGRLEALGRSTDRPGAEGASNVASQVALVAPLEETTGPPATKGTSPDPTPSEDALRMRAANAFKLATSSSLGLEIFVDHDGQEWCSDRLRLRVEAEDPGVFASSGMPNLLRKLVKVVEAECAAARTASVHGYAADGDRRVYDTTLRFEADRN